MLHRIALRGFIVLLGLSWVCAAPFAVADHDAEAADAAAGLLPGHSAHGETFDEGPRRAAYLMGNTGGVKFPITTSSPQAQQFFNQGVDQLHGFWYFEAERSFRQAAFLDPDCAMAYWGMAMANFNNNTRAKGFIGKATDRKGQKGITARERQWIDSLAAFYRDEPKDIKQRKRNFVDALRKMTADYPDDIECKAFYVRYSWEYRRDISADYEAIDKVLAAIFKADPDHPAHHYRIHLWDDKDPKRAVTAAAMCGPSGPGVAHLWHMPGHTYSKLQRFEDAAWQQEASARVDHGYMIRDRVMPYQIHNYAHNNEWLVRDLVLVGRVHDAIDLAKNMMELPRHPKLNSITNSGSSANYGRSRLFEVLTQHEMWDEYLALCDTPYLADEGDVDQRIRIVRYQGVASAATGKADAARKLIATLEELKKQAPATRPATQPASGRGGRGRPSGGGGNPRATAADAAIAHIRGQLALAANDTTGAINFLTKANLRNEHLSQVYAKAGNKDKALELAKKAVDGGRGHTFPLANYVSVLWQCGKKDDAKQQFEQLRNLSTRIDLSAPLYADLEPIAVELGYGVNWRKLGAPASDTGLRPSLDALGPFRWTPPTAPNWAATAADGSTLDLAHYRGKPVVLIFYLGHGCLHCTQQLHAFAPLAKQFADAGISLVGISTDNPAELHQAWEKANVAGEGGKFPFPLASDAGLEIFKRYHCFDDFESMPLHGAFLIDGEGRVRWQEITAEPFMDGPFLLKEAVRLLKQG